MTERTLAAVIVKAVDEWVRAINLTSPPYKMVNNAVHIAMSNMIKTDLANGKNYRQIASTYGVTQNLIADISKAKYSPFDDVTFNR